MENKNIKKKLKNAIKKEPVTGILETKKITAYDIICKNFQLAGRTTFLHRFVYTGHHNFPTSNSYHEIISFFSSTINKPNQQEGGFEKLTGCLVVYPKHFIHLIEGDEDIIHTHLRHLIEHENYNNIFGQIKLLTMIAHINRRLIDDWGYYYGIPQTLSDTADSSEMNIMPITITCILKIYTLINEVVANYDGTARLRSDRLKLVYKPPRDPPNSLDNDSDATLLFHGVGIGSGKLCRLNKDNNYRCHLPECELLDSIIESSWAIDLREYFQNSRVIPQRNLEKDNVWPVPSDFIPYDIFDEVYDRITELPKPTTLLEENKDIDNEGDTTKDKDFVCP